MIKDNMKIGLALNEMDQIGGGYIVDCGMEIQGDVQ